MTKASVPRPLYLISNDDGVHAPGIHALAAAVDAFADWLIVAPQVERSGAGQGISLTMPLRMEQLSDQIYSVEGTPTDCVMFALQKLLKRRPDMVLSGINRGANIGQDTLYSGTVAAAMEGCLHGIPAMAFSLDQRRAFARSDYDAAAAVVAAVLARPTLLAAAKHSVLNVNIPAVPAQAMAGFAAATLGRRIYDHQIVEGIDPRGRPYYWIGGGGSDFLDIPGSDCVLLAARHVTLTALSPEHFDRQVQSTIGLSLEATCAIFPD